MKRVGVGSSSVDFEDEDDDEEEDEDAEMFSKGSLLKSRSSLGEDDEWAIELDKLRSELAEESKRFSIMAEPLMDDEEDSKTAPEEMTPDIQNKRMSIRISVKNISRHKKCTFVRETGTLSAKFYPQYHLYLDDDNNRLLIAAKKCTRNRNASYYLFDMSMEKDVNNCGRDSRNVIGKLVKKNADCTQLVLQRDGDEFAGLVFFRPEANDDFFSIAHPRSMTALIPKLDEMGNTQPHELFVGVKSLTEYILNKDKQHDFVELKSKDPIFYNGCYRLHFLGRMPVIPSVKNFQVCKWNHFHIDELILVAHTSQRSYPRYCSVCQNRRGQVSTRL